VLCSQHNLLITGGSDFHGTREYDEQNFGVFGVSESALKLLEDRRDVVRQSQPA
jgi:hypothetical protein